MLASVKGYREVTPRICLAMSDFHRQNAALGFMQLGAVLAVRRDRHVQGNKRQQYLQNSTVSQKCSGWKRPSPTNNPTPQGSP